MSAAILRHSASLLSAAADLMEESEALLAEASASRLAARPETWVARPRHYLEAVDEGGNKPLCHARDRHGAGWARGYYTSDKGKVTCKRCVKSLAKGEPK